MPEPVKSQIGSARRIVGTEAPHAIAHAAAFIGVAIGVAGAVAITVGVTSAVAITVGVTSAVTVTVGVTRAVTIGVVRRVARRVAVIAVASGIGVVVLVSVNGVV